MKPSEDYMVNDTFQSKCISAFDGSFRNAVSEVKKNLKYPESFEHDSTSYSQNND